MDRCGFLEEGTEVLEGTGLGELWPHFLGLLLSPEISESTATKFHEQFVSEEKKECEVHFVAKLKDFQERGMLHSERKKPGVSVQGVGEGRQRRNT